MVIFVSHFFRGTDSHGQAPFRAAYSRVGNIKAILKGPMLCLTATASTKLRGKIIKMLNMTCVKTIRMSPDKRNVKYVVEKAQSELQDTFGWLISDIINNAHAEKTIIFCQSLKACGDIYDTFLHFVTCKSKVAMYHSKTPQDIKDNVLSDLMSPNGNIYLVIATSALGMGVNIPNIRRVVIFGVPESMESYLQAFGRGGRDGSDVLSVMFYHAYHLCHCDTTMRAFVKNKVNCGRGEILQFFNEKIEKPSILHKCCDVCSKQCNCGACPEEMFKICSDLDNCPYTLERKVNTNERDTFTEVLKDLAVTCQANISVFGSVCFHNVLTDAIVSDLAADLEHLFTVDYILQNFPIFNEKLAAEILMVANDIFNDVEETTHLRELCEMDWNDCEEFLVSIPEQSPPDSDETDCNQVKWANANVLVSLLLFTFLGIDRATQ